MLGAAQLRRFVVFVIDGSLTHSSLLTLLSFCVSTRCRSPIEAFFRYSSMNLITFAHKQTHMHTDERPLSLSLTLSHRSGVCVGVLVCVYVRVPLATCHDSLLQGIFWLCDETVGG